MESMRSFELKVGLFILTGLVLLIIIIFSIGDLNISKAGYYINVTFDFAAGLGTSAPVRLAGVAVGRVDDIGVVYHDKDKRTYAKVRAWIQEDAKIEKDATVTINTLGLLGEKYLEILPGTPGSPILANGDSIDGKDPVMMEKVTEKLVGITDSVSVVVERLKNGEGTIGKLLVSDNVYDDLEGTMANIRGFTEKLNTGQGTVGKLLTDDTIYNEMEAFVKDLKAHPWKLLNKPRGY